MHDLWLMMEGWVFAWIFIRSQDGFLNFDIPGMRIIIYSGCMDGIIQ